MKKKTIKCPHCKAKIDYLINEQAVFAEYEFRLDKDGNGKYGKGEITEIYDDDHNYWDCPECNEMIATSENSAIMFLSGEDINEEEDE